MTAKLGLDQSAYQSGLAMANRAADKFAGSVANSMKGLGASIVGAFAFDRLIAGFSTAIEKGDQLQDLANRFGVSASAIQEVGNAASLSGGSIEDVAKAFNKLAQNAGAAVGGNQQLQEAFAAIGLGVDDLQRLSPQELFFALSKALSEGSLGARDFDIAMQLAGRSSASLMETMRMGPASIQATGQAMGVFSDETAARLSAASDNIKKMQNAFIIGFGEIIGATMELVDYYKKNPLDLITKSWDEVEKNIAEQKTADQLRKRFFPTSREKSMQDVRRTEEGADLSAAGASRGGDSPAEKLAKWEKEFKKTRMDKDMEETRRARAFERESSDDLQELLRKNAEDAAERDQRYQQELFSAEMDALKYEEDFRKKRRQERESRSGALQTRAASATEILDRSATLGGGMEQTVARERAKQAAEQQKSDRRAFDAAVRASTSEVTAQGAQRTMASRRQEFIAQQAKTEARGGKSLTDIFTVLQDTLNKITSTPMVN